MKSKPEELFWLQLKAMRIKLPEREYKFHPSRKWRFDFAWVEEKFAVEIEGGTGIYGRHNRPDGFQKDCEKYGEAMLLGWNVYRCTSVMVNNLSAVEFVRRFLGKYGEVS